MSQTTLTDDDVLVQFDAPDHLTPDDVPDPILRVARYIVANTGLTGDYNDGIVQFAENGNTIQWYPRGRMFSSNDNLLTWLQEPRNADVVFGQVGTREHPEKGETGGYIEIHEAHRWGIETDPDNV